MDSVFYRVCPGLRTVSYRHFIARQYGSKKQSRPWKQKPNRNPRLKIILTEDVPNLGSKSQLVRVKHGYGRNFLIPQGKAVYATPYNIEKFDITEEEIKGKKEVSKTDSVHFIANYLKEKTLVVRQDPEEYKWRVHKQAISRAFFSSLQLYVPMDCIIMENPITEFGPAQVDVQLSDDLTVSVDVDIVSYVSSKVQRKRDKKLAKHAESLS
jgi:large subunit ribosomal protein L9